ncbi:MAG: hypothetical protein QGF09_04510 [Rhodospirillales bacterium]|jgi:hypothetical protein|nr:hypothetical protein [Rhodospirillales bacterium]
MSDGIQIPSLQTPVPQRASSGYQSAREVERRAAITRRNDAPAHTCAVDRLNRILESGKPLRDDVPRGFHLNIQV